MKVIKIPIKKYREGGSSKSLSSKVITNQNKCLPNMSGGKSLVAGYKGK